jgi:hypothetical protein
VNENSLRNIIQFAYTGKTTLDINSVQDLLVAANYLQIDIIAQKCEDFIKNNIANYENEDIVYLLRFANFYDMKSFPTSLRISTSGCITGIPCTSTDKFIFISNDFMSTGFN